MYTMTVAPGADVSGGFYSLKAAFAAMPEDPAVPVTIRVMPGIYHEKLSLTRPNVTIEGRRSIPVRHRDLLRRLRLRDHVGSASSAEPSAPTPFSCMPQTSRCAT